MDNLVAFLTARLDEDEAAALKDTNAPAEALRFVDADEWSQPLIWLANADRVLREVEAKRAILADHATDPEVGCITSCKTCDAEFSLYPCRTVRLLALPYADHPDYDQSWEAS